MRADAAPGTGALRFGRAPGAWPFLGHAVALLRRPLVLPAGEVLRAVRAVWVLELTGTPAARQVLQKLAGGAPQARLTREARAALGRLAVSAR